MLTLKLINQMLMNEAGEDGAASGGASTVQIVSEDLEPQAEVFEALAEEFEEEDLEGVGSTPTGEVENSGEVKPAAEVQTPVVAPVTPATPAPAVQQPQPASAVQEAPQPQPAVQSPAPAATVTPSRDQVVSSIEKLFAITNEDDIVQLRTEPEKVLPRILAGLFYDVQNTVMAQFQNSLPDMLQTVSDRAQANHQAEGEFYTQWPELKDEKYKDVVMQAAKAYRQVNPNADRATAVREIGALAMIRAQIPFDMRTGKRLQQDQQPTAQPFKPAVTAASGAAPNTSGQVSVWESLVEEFENEDRVE